MEKTAILCALALGVGASLRAAAPSNDEQYMLELVNRMRMHPAEELAILTNITGGAWDAPRSDEPHTASALTFFNVDAATLVAQWASLAPAAPLAWNSSLNDAAYAHNLAVIDSDTQSHQLPGEPPPYQRAVDAGFGSIYVGENLFAYTSTVDYGHAGFAIDWGSTATGIQDPPGHRDNLMLPDYREVGISITLVTALGKTVGPLVVTQDFGWNYNNPDPFLTGVVFNDSILANDFYTPGEGLGGVLVEAFQPGTMTLAGMTTTWSSGGYSLELPNGTYDVRFTSGGTVYEIPNVVLANGENTKLDAINAIPEPHTLALSLCGLAVLAGIAHRRRVSAA